MTTTYDPFTVIERPKVGIFAGLPSAAPGSVLVVDRQGHPLRVLAGPGDRLTAGEVRWGQIRTLYAVDVTEHHLEFAEVLPCRDDVGGFRAAMSITCVVADPAAVVQRGIHDVTRTLVPAITETLRRVCASFPAEDSERAEVAALRAVRDREAERPHDSAFRIISIHLVLTLEESAATFVHELKENDRNSTRQKDAARLELEKTKLEAELSTVRSELQAAQMRAEQQVTVKLEVERLEMAKQQQQAQAELDRQKLELDMARSALEEQFAMQMLKAKLDRQNVEVTQLTTLLSQGEFGALALQLSQNPAAIGDINNYLARQRSVDADRQLSALKLMLDSDGLEGWQITDQAKHVLRQLIDSWSARAKPLAAGPDSPVPAVAIDVRDVPSEEAVSDDDGQFPGDRVDSATSVVDQSDSQGA